MPRTELLAHGLFLTIAFFELAFPVLFAIARGAP